MGKEKEVVIQIGYYQSVVKSTEIPKNATVISENDGDIHHIKTWGLRGHILKNGEHKIFHSWH